MQTTTYFYSKASSIFFTLFPAVLIAFSIPNLIKFITAHDSINWQLILLFDFFIALLLLYVVTKQLIPSLKNKVALELNANDLVSFSKNVSIPWKIIEKIDLISGKSSSALYITFKDETDNGTRIRIPLGFVKGNDDEIYNTVLKYYHKAI